MKTKIINNRPTAIVKKLYEPAKLCETSYKVNTIAISRMNLNLAHCANKWQILKYDHVLKELLVVFKAFFYNNRFFKTLITIKRSPAYLKNSSVK